jgi:peptidoglycan hydrolase CwlO-like protein
MIITDFANIMATVGGSSIISSWITYLFAKRKYRNETDSIEIDNLKKSLGFYQEMIDDFKNHIDLLEDKISSLQNKINTMEAEFDMKLQNSK